jgi:hypothetical protein
MIQSFKINALPSTINLGKAGENECTTLSFDVTAWKTAYPDGLVSIAFRRPDLTNAYIVVANSSANPVLWAVDSTALDSPGYGELVLRIASNGIICKSATVLTNTLDSPDWSGVTPDPYPDWVQDTLDAAANVVAALSALTVTGETLNIS